MMFEFNIREVTPADGDRVARLARERWGSDVVVAHGVAYDPAALPGFAALRGDKWMGLVTYHIADDECEIVTIDSLVPGQGVGTALVEAVKGAAVDAGCKRLWLITTNDNLHGLRFYQKRGFVLVAIHRDAIARSRQLKPEIPLIGANGIPIRDEIELELALVD